MTGIIVLAAGESRRLGQPKQLVRWKGNPLVRHAAQVALEAGLGPVAVVLGAIDNPCREALTGLPVKIIYNFHWSDGMGSSISAGVSELDDALLDGIIVMLCDQPLINADALRLLVSEREKTGSAVVASRSGEALGPPAFFAASRFEQLIELQEKDGARSIIQGEPSLSIVDCAAAAFDVDTPDALEELQRRDTEHQAGDPAL